MGENLKKLKDKGVVVGDLPKRYEKVIDELSDTERDAIIAIKERLEKEDAKAGAGTVTADVPAYVSFIRF